MFEDIETHKKLSKWIMNCTQNIGQIQSIQAIDFIFSR